MTINTTILLQLILTICQVINAVNVEQLPGGWQAGFMGILTIAQAVQAVIAHNYTPTGVKIQPGDTLKTPSTGLEVAAHEKQV